MMTLLTGGSKCGKSSLAERLLLELPPPRLYIATMQVFGQEEQAIVRRHQAMRQGKGFCVMEAPKDISALPLPPRASVLLEDVPNLLANHMFSQSEPNVPKETVDTVFSSIHALRQAGHDLLLITNEVGADGLAYPPLTQSYIRALGTLNCRLAQTCDRVIEVVYGTPQAIKGRI